MLSINLPSIDANIPLLPPASRAAGKRQFAHSQIVSLPMGTRRIKSSPWETCMRLHSKKSGRILDEIRLKDLVIPCTIGIYPEETKRVQDVHLNVCLYLDTSTAARSGRLHQTIDYSALAHELQFILTNGHFRLLESAAEAMAHYILAAQPQDVERAACEAVEIELIKPEALPGICLPSLRILRQKEDLVTSHDASTWDMIFVSPETAVFRGVVPAQTRLKPWLPGWTIAAIMTSSAGLSFASRALNMAEELLGPELQDQYLSNSTEQPRSFLGLARRDPKARPLASQPAALSLLQPSFL